MEYQDRWPGTIKFAPPTSYHPYLQGKKLSKGSFRSEVKAEHFLRKVAARRGYKLQRYGKDFIDTRTNKLVGEIREE